MQSPLFGNDFPYELPSGILYFHDWRHLHWGWPTWRTAEGERPALFGDGSPPSLRFSQDDAPRGIRLVAQRAAKVGPIFDWRDAGEEFLLCPGTVIRDGGRYRMWYDGLPARRPSYDGIAAQAVARYAESDDGMGFRFPELGLHEERGSRRNNIVVHAAAFEPHGYGMGGGFFLDPHAGPAERYKCVHLGYLSREETAAFALARPDAVDPLYTTGQRAAGKRLPHGLFGALSPDGLSWTPIREPLVILTSDTMHAAEWDPKLGAYVVYCRGRLFGCRSIGRIQSPSFREFRLPEIVSWTDASQDPAHTWYQPGKTAMPEAPDYHVMFPLRWDQHTDRFEVHLATSPDNVTWGFVPGSPVLEPGEPGGWDGGTVAAGVGLVDLPGGRIGVPFVGTPWPHKYPRRPGFGAMGWATWPRDRLVALHAPGEGSFRLQPLRVPDRTMRLDFRTPMAGSVEVEVWAHDPASGHAGYPGSPVPGRTFADCDRLSGDHAGAQVTWRGNPDLGYPESAPWVTLRFRLRCAELFSIRFGK